MGTKLKMPDKNIVKKILSKEPKKANVVERLVRVENVENMKAKGYTVVGPHKAPHQFTSDLVLMKK